MDLHEALYTTRAMRRMKPDPIPLEVQQRILDAAVRAPTIGEEWRFLLIDDPDVRARLAPLYAQAREELFAGFGITVDQVMQGGGAAGRAAQSGNHLAQHFREAPLILIGFGRNRDGSAVLPALWSAMLAARAEGIGSTLTGVLQTYRSAEVFELLGVPADEGWHMHGVVPMGYPLGRWGVAPRRPVHEVANRNSWDGDLGFTVPAPLWPASGSTR